MKLILSLAFSFISSLAYGQLIDGQDRGNGGDLCEMRFNEIRNDFQNWILNGGSGSLQLPYGITLIQYDSTMLEQMSKAIVSCTQKVLSVGVAEKTCLNFTDDQGRPRILCNFDRFMKTTDSQQYVLVHHEYAGLARFEVNNGEKSDYSISAQISDYFRQNSPIHLDITPVQQCPLDSYRSISERMAVAIYENKLECIRSLAPMLGFSEMVLIYRFEPLENTLPNERFFILPPVSFAAALGRTDAIKILLDAGFNVNYTNAPSVFYPLSVAAKVGSIEAIELLVQKGAVLNQNSSKSYNPVDAALSNLEEKYYPHSRVFRTVETLLKLGADPNILSFGQSPLSRAAEHFDLVDLLIKYGASPTLTDDDGRSALFFCRTKACVDKFVGLGVAVNSVDSGGLRAIDVIDAVPARDALLSHGSVPRQIKK
jgi:ankyrin repeat protein